MLAKICSDLNKPNGQYELLNETEAKDFVAHLSCRKIGGIGNVTEQLLGNNLFPFSKEIVVCIMRANKCTYFQESLVLKRVKISLIKEG